MCTFAPGEMAEWSIAAVLKTVDLQGSGGSNPSLSAPFLRNFHFHDFIGSFTSPGSLFMMELMLFPISQVTLTSLFLGMNSI